MRASANAAPSRDAAILAAARAPTREDTARSSHPNPVAPGSHLRRVLPTTMYDIASLTKVVATTTLVAKLAEGDFPVPLDLDAKLERYLPEWARGQQPEWRHRMP